MEIAGRVLVEAQDGGLMIQTRDGTIWNVQPEDLIHRARDDVVFAPFSAQEMSRQTSWPNYRPALRLIAPPIT